MATARRGGGGNLATDKHRFAQIKNCSRSLCEACTPPARRRLQRWDFSFKHLCSLRVNPWQSLRLRWYLHYPHNPRLSLGRRAISSHQRHESAAAGDFEFAKDRVEMLFHHWQTQGGVISDLLITPSFADKPRNFLFAPGQSGKMRQTGTRRSGTRSRAQIFAFDKKMRPRHAG